MMSRAAAEDAQRIAAADRLAERAQVGRDAQILLRAAGPHAEGAQHFVEDQQHAMLARQPAQGGHELRRRQDAAGVVVDRLADDGGQFVGVAAKRLFEQIGPVVRHQDQVAASSPGGMPVEPG